MLSGFLQLLCFLLAGETLVHLLALPVPGPVLGMALLLAWLLWRGGETPANIRQASLGLLQYLSLLFVPVGAGIVLHIDRLTREWPAILGSAIGATLVCIGLAGLLFQALAAGRQTEKDQAADHE